MIDVIVARKADIDNEWYGHGACEGVGELEQHHEDQHGGLHRRCVKKFGEGPEQRLQSPGAGTALSSRRAASAIVESSPGSTASSSTAMMPINDQKPPSPRELARPGLRF